ncbi:acetate/propionate family kinase [Inquilinus limosus]|uniref:Acetate kinase n=1 Tax=Inquilinus limosus MP06 TaxID=1398085 RepID=A0A0A0DB27_9PROT|nr:acetate/propionate family kinase [Inquilinus limosus]KGM35871.1 acetate kinase [Inquilinus limosus MP06]
MPTEILALNAGSSSIKLGLFEERSGRAVRRVKAALDLKGRPPALRLEAEGVSDTVELGVAHAGDLRAMLDGCLRVLDDRLGLDGLALAGHRVVHGGEAFTGPVRITEEVLAALEALVPLAPLHQPPALRLIEAMGALRPGIVQTASFDTAFHAGQADRVRRFALPRALHDRGIKRYGFHGLSYRFIADALRLGHPELAAGRVVVAHLGSGASLCALRDGASVETTMGFSALDGVPMATRPGALDAGVLLHLLGPDGMAVEEVEDLLYHRAGLLGLSGISGDTRDLLASADPAAAKAIDIFTFRIAQAVASLSVTLGGLDALVFTAGIGEHQPEIRDRICDHLRWLGVAPDGPVTVLVIPTDEEQVVADEALRVRIAEP